MPRFYSKDVSEEVGYEPLPDDDYLVRLENIEERDTKSGSYLWSLKFEVIKPAAFKGRFIYDNMVFSEKAYPRVKLICSRLGGIKEDEKGYMNVEIEDLLGKYCYVNTEQDTYEGKTRAKVTYNGYTALDKDDLTREGLVAPDSKDDNIPF